MKSARPAGTSGHNPSNSHSNSHSNMSLGTMGVELPDWPFWWAGIASLLITSAALLAIWFI
jgi:hypothetical protein